MKCGHSSKHFDYIKHQTNDYDITGITRYTEVSHETRKREYFVMDCVNTNIRKLIKPNTLNIEKEKKLIEDYDITDENKISFSFRYT